MRRILLLLILTFSTLLVSCSQNGENQISATESLKSNTCNVQTSKGTSNLNAPNQKSTSKTISDSNTETENNMIDIFSIKGNWASSPKSKIYSLNYDLGGLLMRITESDSQHIKGEIMQIQLPPANRMAAVEFNDKLINNVLQFDYKDDGFGSSGNCKIYVKSNNSIEVSIKSIGTADTNMSGWRISTQEIEFKKLPDLKDEELYKQLIEEYEQAMTKAINDNLFYEVKPYLVDNSALYKSQKQLISNLHNKHITEELLNVDVNSIEDYNDNGKISKRIKVHEKFNIKSPSGNQIKEFDYFYYAANSPDEFALYDISTLNDNRVDSRKKLTPEEVTAAMGEGYLFSGVDYATGFYNISWPNPGKGTGWGGQVDPYTGDIYSYGGQKTGNISDKGQQIPK